MHTFGSILSIALIVFTYGRSVHATKLEKVLEFLCSALFWYYIWLPACNFQDPGLWLMLGVFVLLAGILMADPINSSRKKGYSLQLPKWTVWSFAAVVLIPVLSAVLFSPLFQARAYSRRIMVTNTDFAEVPSYNVEETAIIDRDSAELLGDKTMGQMQDLVSQFVASDEYTQISWNGASVRVTPLAYDGFIKYMRNRKSGIPAYIQVSTTSGSTKLQRLTECMHYVPSAYFHENLSRRLRFRFPTIIFGNPSFEIDEEGKPWYVCTTYGYAGIQSRKRVTGVILFDPVTGEASRYGTEDIPDWVDRVYPAELVLQELNNWGSYQKGFFNSIFGQEGVIKTSEGYNYLAKDGDVWLYTGMTSAAADDSNIGFMLVNLRTHEADYTAASGASEAAVMASAEGEVLNYGYTATFPTLLNVAGKPVYLLSLKDSAGLVKMYAMVDAEDYQQVYTVKADRGTAAVVSSLIREVSGGTEIAGDVSEQSFTIASLRTAVIDGNTYLFLWSEKDVYRIKLTEDNAPKALSLKEGDEVRCMVVKREDGTFDITDLS